MLNGPEVLWDDKQHLRQLVRDHRNGLLGLPTSTELGSKEPSSSSSMPASTTTREYLAPHEKQAAAESPHQAAAKSSH